MTTQCPKCHTSFRVTEAQLSIANGAVRCGSCLHIFNAPEHWVSAPAKPTPPPPPPAAADDDDRFSDDGDSTKPKSFMALDDEPEPAFNDTIEQGVLDDIFDEDLISEENTDFLEHQLELEDERSGSASTRHSAIGDSLATDTSTDDEPEIDDDELISDDMLIDDDEDDRVTGDSKDAHDRDFDDELISDDMLFDDGDDDGDSKSFRDTGQFSVIRAIDDDNPLTSEFDERRDDNTTGDFSDSFLEIDSWEKEDKRVFRDLDELGDDSGPGEEDWARKLMDDEDSDDKKSSSKVASTHHREAPDILPEFEDDEEPEPEDPFQDIFEEMDNDDAEEETFLDDELRDILNERDSTPDVEPVEEDEFVLGDEPMLAGERIGSEKLALLANIEPEPLVFAATGDRSRWVRLGWMGAIVLALLAFGVQYVYFNFDRLARDNSYRGLLGGVCGVVGCTIPERDDVRLIRSTNLLVRSHPSTAHALVVDAILSNRADFEQHFPDMELQFTDLQGNIVAARQFAPAEYLSGELAGTTMMPIRQPVHVSLDLVDPGAEAVNYQLRLLPHQNR